jgi:hypothetical protein
MRSSTKFIGLSSTLLLLAAGTAEATCKSGFVWRDARNGDTICVTTDDRDVAQRQNANGPNNRATGAGATCRSGYVWREAWAGDTVCVTPTERDQAGAQNAANAQHTLTAAAPPPHVMPARNNQACLSYANKASSDYKLGAAQRECVSKVRADAGRWNGDVSRHYDWCVAVQKADRDSEDKARDKILRDCGARATF